MPTIVHETLSSAGTPLDTTTRAFFERRFGHDFGRVRVHADTRAVESSDAVNALAYTVGSDIVFGAGQYAPGTGSGDWLLAHELAHVDQQTRGGTPALQRLSQEQTPADWRYVSNYRRFEPANYERRVAGVASERAALEAEVTSSADPSPVLRDLVRLTALDLMIDYRNDMIAARDSLRDPAAGAAAMSATREAAGRILALDEKRRDLERSLFALGGLTQNGVSPFSDEWAATIATETSTHVNDAITKALETYANREEEAFRESNESIGWILANDLRVARTQQILRTTDQINGIYKEFPYLTQFFLRDPLSEVAESLIGDPTGDFVSGAKRALGKAGSFVEGADVFGILASTRQFGRDTLQSTVSERAGPTLEQFADNTFGSNAAYVGQLRDAYGHLIENINIAIGLIGSEQIEPFRLPEAVTVAGKRFPEHQKQLKLLAQRAELMVLAKTLGLSVLETAVALIPVVGPALAFATNLYSSASDFQRTMDERTLGKAAPSPEGTLGKASPSPGEVLGSGLSTVASAAGAGAGAAGLAHSPHVDVPDLDVSPVRVRPESSGDIAAGPRPSGETLVPQATGPTLVPESTPRSTGPTLVPEATPRTTGPTLVPESTPRTTGPTIAPESTPQTTGPTIAPESTPQPTGPTIAPESTPQTTGPTIAPESTPQTTGPTIAPESTPQTTGPTIAPEGTPQTTGPTIAPEGTGGGTTGPPSSGGGRRRRGTGPTLVPESTGQTLVPEGGGGGPTAPPPSGGGRRRRRTGPTLVPESTGPTLVPESIEPRPVPRTRRRTVPTQIPESIGTSSTTPAGGRTVESVRAEGTVEYVTSAEPSADVRGSASSDVIETGSPRTSGEYGTPYGSARTGSAGSGSGSGQTLASEAIPMASWGETVAASVVGDVDTLLRNRTDVPYLPQFENAKLRPKALGSGAFKTAYAIEGPDNLAIARLDKPENVGTLLKELDYYKKLKEIGVPTAEIIGITYHEGKPALVMRHYRGGSSKGILHEKQSAAALNERSIRDLHHIREVLEHNVLLVSDMQFLIDTDGAVVLADPMPLMFGVTNLIAINPLIHKAVVQVLRRNIQRGVPYSADQLRALVGTPVADEVWDQFLVSIQTRSTRELTYDSATKMYMFRPRITQ